jgi:hypothetical protein
MTPDEEAEMMPEGLLQELKAKERANRLADYVLNLNEYEVIVPLASELMAPRDQHGEVAGQGW